jgi:hypothetical protein
MNVRILLSPVVLLVLAPCCAPGQPTFSSNIVGYVNVSLPADDRAAVLLANPLRCTNDDISTVLPIPDSAYGTQIYKFDLGRQAAVEDPGVFLGGIGWDPSDLQLPPGEGFWIYPNESYYPSLNVTFVGEAPAHVVTNRLPAANRYALLGSQVPAELPIGDARATNTLRFPAEDGDTIYLFDPQRQRLKEPYTYYDGYGWSSANADDPGPRGPVLPLATSFFILKGPGATQTNWLQPGIVEGDGPMLNVQYLGFAVEVSWLATSTGYRLQQSLSLSSPTWTDVVAAPAIFHGYLTVLMPVVGRQAYFRLMRP